MVRAPTTALAFVASCACATHIARMFSRKCSIDLTPTDAALVSHAMNFNSGPDRNRFLKGAAETSAVCLDSSLLLHMEHRRASRNRAATNERECFRHGSED